MASFDRRKCKGPLNGPTATGQHCPEGWTFYAEPLPQLKGVTDSGSAEGSYYTWVDQFDTLGLGANTPIDTGNASEGLLALKDGKWVVLRVPYPLGFYTKWMDGRIDDPNAGWKGRGLWATVSTRAPFHMETGKGTTSKVISSSCGRIRWRIRAMGMSAPSRHVFRSDSARMTAVVILALVCAIAPPRARAQAQQAESRSSGLEVIQIRPTVYAIFGAGANIVVQVGPDGAIVVDSGTTEKADAVVAAIKRLTSQPIRIIFNTSVDADHVGGNETLAKAGFAYNENTVFTGGSSADIVAREEVLLRMSAPTGERSRFATPLWPTETFTQNTKSLYANGEGIQAVHQPAAHSDGDSIVIFRRADVVAVGDIVDLRHFPIYRPRVGRQHSGRTRRAQPLGDARDPCDAARLAGRPHSGRARSWAADGSGRGGRVPRHGHHHSRQHPAPDGQADDARTNQGGQPHRRVSETVRLRHRRLDDGHVRRGDLS